MFPGWFSAVLQLVSALDWTFYINHPVSNSKFPISESSQNSQETMMSRLILTRFLTLRRFSPSPFASTLVIVIMVTIQPCIPRVLSPATTTTIDYNSYVLCPLYFLLLSLHQSISLSPMSQSTNDSRGLRVGRSVGRRQQAMGGWGDSWHPSGYYAFTHNYNFVCDKPYGMTAIPCLDFHSLIRTFRHFGLSSKLFLIALAVLHPALPLT